MSSMSNWVQSTLAKYKHHQTGHVFRQVKTNSITEYKAVIMAAVVVGGLACTPVLFATPQSAAKSTTKTYAQVERNQVKKANTGKVAKSSKLNRTAAPQADSNTDGDGYTAPAPTKSDASGTAQDQYYIPVDNFMHPQYADGSYRVNGQAVAQGWHSTNGASSVTITTDFNSGTWTFDYSSTTTGTEATNSYWTKAYACNSSKGRFPVSIFAENTDDSTNLLIERINVVLNRSGSQIPVDSPSAYNIQDGETREIPVDSYVGGIPPGVWDITVYQYRSGNSKIVKKLQISLPACGQNQPPNQGGNTNDPYANIRYARAKASTYCKVDKGNVLLDNRKRATASTYKVVVRVPHKSQRVITKKVAAHQKANVKLAQLRGSSQVIVSVIGKTGVLDRAVCQR